MNSTISNPNLHSPSVSAHDQEGTVNAVIRALSILDLLGQANEELGVTEISHETNLHKSTVFRLLNTLALSGYIKQNPENGKYALSIHLVQLGMSVLNRIDLRRVARPYLEELLNTCGEAVHLGILDQGDVIYIDKIDVDRPLTMGSRIGGKSPGYCTGLGKVLMAYLPEPELQQLVTKRKFCRFTVNTIVEPNQLLEHLARIREQGYALDDEEHELGIRCLAVPIKDHKGNVVAAVSVSGPTLRMTREKLDQITPRVIAVGQRISLALGYLPR